MIDIEHRSFEATLERCAELGGADLIFTSPPYPTEVPGAKGAAGAPTRRYGGDTPEHFLWPDYQRLGDLCYRALRPGGFCIVIIDGPVRTIDKEIGSERSTIGFKLAEDWRWAKRSDGLRFRYVEHEAYVRSGMPGRFGPRRRSGWEPMHVFQRPGGTSWFDASSSMLPSVSGGEGVNNSTGSRSATGYKGRGRKNEQQYVIAEYRQLTTAITAIAAGPVVSKEVADTEHPAPFTRYIAAVQTLGYCPPGGIICDPFVGSGTTAIAALRHGRGFVGGDLGVRERDGRRWADIARERALEAEQTREQEEEQRAREREVISGPAAEAGNGSEDGRAVCGGAPA